MNPVTEIQKLDLSWIAWYEQLRSEALQSPGFTSTQGVGIFRNRGLAGWHRIISEMSFTVHINNADRNAERSNHITPLSTETQSEFVQALAALISSQFQRGHRESRV